MDRVESEDRAPLAVEVQHEPNGPVLRLTGELDLSSIGVLQEALDPLIRAGLQRDVERLARGQAADLNN